MATDVLRALYEGRRADALALAEARALDLHEAAALGRTQRVAELLESEGINRPAPDGFTALHLAAFFGQVGTARLLVERGADVEAVGPGRLRPLHSAAAGGEAEIVRLLLAAGADPEQPQERGFVPLHAAALRGDEGMTEALLAAGASVATRDGEGRTAADFAGQGGHQALAERLRRP